MFKVRRAAWWVAEVNSMCACIFIYALSPPVFWLAWCLYTRGNTILAFYNSTNTQGVHTQAMPTNPREGTTKGKQLSGLAQKSIFTCNNWDDNNKVQVLTSTTRTNKPELIFKNIRTHKLFFSSVHADRLQCFTKNLPGDKNSLIRLFIMFSCYSVI